MEERLAFRVDCEWLCNFVRQRVWYEGLSFTEGLELIRSVFTEMNESDRVAILTGAKKVVGINSGELVPDCKTEEYLSYIRRQEKAKLDIEIREDITVHPFSYLDPFATRWNPDKYLEDIEEQCLIPTFESMEKYFMKAPCSREEDPLFLGGMYSINPSFVDKVIKEDSDKEEFYEKLYSYWEDYLKSIPNLSKDIIEQVKLRQRAYLKYKNKPEENKQRADELEKEATSRRPDWVIKDDGTYNLVYGSEVAYQRGSKLVPCDRGVFFKQGIISPTGDFYACDFASHNVASWVIARQNGWMSSEDYGRFDEWEDAKDMLYDKGFIFVNLCGGSSGTFYSKYGDAIEDFPQKAMDTAYDFIIWEREKYN